MSIPAHPFRGDEKANVMRASGGDVKYLILLSGKAQAGKDTFADSIASLGFHKYSFSEALKTEASRGGWDGAKDERGRILLQELGSVWRHYEPDHWIRRLQDSITHDLVAITDCRYRNEISLMQRWGYQNGYNVATVRIERPGYDNGLSNDAKAHDSECELDDEGFDMVVYNYGPLLDFCANVRWVAKCMLSGSWWA